MAMAAEILSGEQKIFSFFDFLSCWNRSYAKRVFASLRDFMVVLVWTGAPGKSKELL